MYSYPNQSLYKDGQHRKAIKICLLAKQAITGLSFSRSSNFNNNKKIRDRCVKTAKITVCFTSNYRSYNQAIQQAKLWKFAKIKSKQSHLAILEKISFVLVQTSEKAEVTKYFFRPSQACIFMAKALFRSFCKIKTNTSFSTVRPRRRVQDQDKTQDHFLCKTITKTNFGCARPR